AVAALPASELRAAAGHPVRALRRAQAAAFGGSAWVCAAVAESRLGARLGTQEQEAFALSALRWVCQQQDELQDPRRVTMVVDGMAEMHDADSSFACAGKTAKSMLRAVEAYRQTTITFAGDEQFDVNVDGIKGLFRDDATIPAGVQIFVPYDQTYELSVQTKPATIRIAERGGGLSLDRLIYEGKQLGNCLEGNFLSQAKYVSRARDQSSSFWSMTVLRKDIFRSRWKRFYKRCYRPRTRGKTVDLPPPHEQGKLNTDGVPAPWKLRVSVQDAEMPPESRRLAWQLYRSNFYDYTRGEQWSKSNQLQQMQALGDAHALNHVLRCLDPGIRRRCDSGYGRPETMAEFSPDSVPEHVYNEIAERAKQEGGKAQEFLDNLQGMAGMKEGGFETFPEARFYELCEENETLWHEVAVNARGRPLGDWQGPRGAEQQGDAARGPDRGHFPYIDEQAALVDELRLDEVLRLRHRRSERRHPKWIEKAYQAKPRHEKYLHQRAISLDEIKERMGVLKQGIAV
ncbi:unnamed protein product, partial [Prorocentrum cordatum]